MSEPLEQRWATAPDKQWKLRELPLHWQRGDAERVEAFVTRQERFTADVMPWVTERAARYQAQWEHRTAAECRREAMIDLVCWQRREPNAAEMLRWVREWERATSTEV